MTAHPRVALDPAVTQDGPGPTQELPRFWQEAVTGMKNAGTLPTRQESSPGLVLWGGGAADRNLSRYNLRANFASEVWYVS